MILQSKLNNLDNKLINLYQINENMLFDTVKAFFKWIKDKLINMVNAIKNFLKIKPKSIPDSTTTSLMINDKTLISINKCIENNIENNKSILDLVNNSMHKLTLGDLANTTNLTVSENIENIKKIYKGISSSNDVSSEYIVTIDVNSSIKSKYVKESKKLSNHIKTIEKYIILLNRFIDTSKKQADRQLLDINKFNTYIKPLLLSMVTYDNVVLSTIAITHRYLTFSNKSQFAKYIIDHSKSKATSMGSDTPKVKNKPKDYNNMSIEEIRSESADIDKRILDECKKYTRTLLRKISELVENGKISTDDIKRVTYEISNIRKDIDNGKNCMIQLHELDLHIRELESNNSSSIIMTKANNKIDDSNLVSKLNYLYSVTEKSDMSRLTKYLTSDKIDWSSIKSLYDTCKYTIIEGNYTISMLEYAIVSNELILMLVNKYNKINPQKLIKITKAEIGSGFDTHEHSNARDAFPQGHKNSKVSGKIDNVLLVGLIHGRSVIKPLVTVIK